MKNYLIAFVMCSMLSLPVFGAEGSLRVNLIAQENGKDQKIIREALIGLGHAVHDQVGGSGAAAHEADVNIHLKSFSSEKSGCALHNWLLAGSEVDQEELDQADLVLCHTHEQESEYQKLGYKTFYLGFSSADCQRLGIEKDFSSYLYDGSEDILVETEAVVEAWEGDFGMPALTLIVDDSRSVINQDNVRCIREQLPSRAYREIQNSCGIHLCFGQSGSFSHALLEAMSTGGVVITLNSSPMNEQVLDKRCLVSADLVQLKSVVQNLQLLSDDELRKIGEQNRARFVQIKEEFHENLKILLESM